MQRKPPQNVGAGEIGCETCSVLESIRSRRYKRYLEIEEQRKREPAMTDQLSREMNAVTTELVEAQLRMVEHRRSHVLVRVGKATAAG
jgi:hypothetical protein